MAATAIITVVGVLGFVLGILMVVPALITQLLDLIDVLPDLFKQLRGSSKNSSRPCWIGSRTRIRCFCPSAKH